MMGIVTAFIIAVILYAVNTYKKGIGEKEEAKGIGKLLENKWYVDELYDAVIVRPLHSFAGFLKNVIEKTGIDGVVNGVGKFVAYGSRQLRLVQSGQVANYLLIMILSMVIFFIIWFNDLHIMRFINKLF